MARILVLTWLLAVTAHDRERVSNSGPGRRTNENTKLQAASGDPTGETKQHYRCFDETAERSGVGGLAHANLGGGTWVSAPDAYNASLISLDVSRDVGGGVDSCLSAIDFNLLPTSRNRKYTCKEAHSGISVRYAPRACWLPDVTASLRRLVVRHATQPKERLRVTILGDSLSRESFLSLLGTLRTRWVSSPLTCAANLNATNDVFWSVRAAFGVDAAAPRFELNYRFTNSPGEAFLNWLDETRTTTDAHERAVGDAPRDVVVFNTAFHNPANASHRIRHLIDAVRGAREQPWRPEDASSRRGLLLVYRQTFAPGFATPTGEHDPTKLRTKCWPAKAAPLRCEQSPVCMAERALFPKLIAAGVVVLEGWEATAEPAAAQRHIGRMEGRDAYDCLHYCLPGPLDSVFTQAFLALLLESLQRGL